MPVSIVQVMNNTSRTLHYHNFETNRRISVAPKTAQYRNNDWIPSSDYHNDGIPFRSVSRIEVKLDDGPSVDISDDDWRFRILGPVDDTRERVGDWYGRLENGALYILRVDEVNDGQLPKAALSFLKYEDNFKVTSGYISSQVIQHATPVVALILVAILQCTK